MPPPRLIFVLLDLCLRDWRSPERQKKIPNRFYIYIMYGKKVRSSLYPLGSGEPPPGAKALLFFFKKASVL